MDTLSSSKHKARKEHRCNFCGGKIEIGTIYDSQSIVDGGDFYVWKSHISCGDLVSKLEMYDWCDDGVSEDDFNSEVQEQYQSIMSNKHTEEYESKDFKYPPFLEQLEIVKKEYGINEN